MKKLPRREFMGAAASALTFVSLSSSTLAAESPLSAGKKDLEELLNEMETKGRNMLTVVRKEAEFLRLMVKATRAKNILEIGTSQGYATIWLALGLQETGGQLTTVEILPERVKLAKTHLERAGLAKRVTFKEGDAHQIVPSLDGPFDFVLLDADKQGHVDYFHKLFPKKLAPGALLLSHNALTLKDMLADYLKLVSEHPEFDTVILSLTTDDGLAVSYRRRA